MDEQIKKIDDLAIIKKYYGEKMMHFCRDYFATLLEHPGLLSDIITNHFDPSRTLYEDLDIYGKMGDFKNFIYEQSRKVGEYAQQEGEKEVIIDTPVKLLLEAGYDLFECHSESDIQSFSSYYAEGEKICTFKGGRLERCYVYFAVKKGAKHLSRSDFSSPERQDEYGTSVISIQFTRDDSHTLSIKNRYNHTVSNPDATFSNNLDNIIWGLTESFAHHYGMTQNHTNQFELPGYVLANDGKYYKYNYEINNVYYCPNNIIIDNFEVKKLPKDDYLVIDYFVIDLKNKTLTLIDNRVKDCFPESITNVSKIDIVKKESGVKEIIITINDREKPVIITIDKNNKIIGLVNHDLKVVENFFLHKNQSLTSLELPLLQDVGHDFLSENQGLTSLELPLLREAGYSFLAKNKGLISLELPSLQRVENSFLGTNQGLTNLELPSLEEAGASFLGANRGLTSLELPLLQKAGFGFLGSNEGLTSLELPSLQRVENAFLGANQGLTSLKLPALQYAGAYFLTQNDGLTSLELPALQYAGAYFLGGNQWLTSLELPSLEEVEGSFLFQNKSLTRLELPSLKQVGDNFLWANQGLTSLELPILQAAAPGFLYCNRDLTSLELPLLQEVGDDFLYSNPALRSALLNNIDAKGR